MSLLLIILIVFTLSLFVLFLWSRYQSMLIDKEDEIRVLDLAKTFFPNAQSNKEALQLLKWYYFVLLEYEDDCNKLQAYNRIVEIANRIIAKEKEIKGQ